MHSLTFQKNRLEHFCQLILRADLITQRIANLINLQSFNKYYKSAPDIVLPKYTLLDGLVEINVGFVISLKKMSALASSKPRDANVFTAHTGMLCSH